MACMKITLFIKINSSVTSFVFLLKFTVVQGWRAVNGRYMFEKKPVGFRLIWGPQSKWNMEHWALEMLGKTLLGNPATCVEGSECYLAYWFESCIIHEV